MLSNQVVSKFKFSDKLVGEIKKQYLNEYNIILSDDEAQEYLHSLADLFDLVTKKRLTVKER